jgi:hypothetical protein
MFLAIQEGRSHWATEKEEARTAPPPMPSHLIAKGRRSDGRTNGQGEREASLPWPWLGPTWEAAHWTSWSWSRRLYVCAQAQKVSVLGLHFPGASASSRTRCDPGSTPSTNQVQSPQSIIRPGSTSNLEKTPPLSRLL